MMNTPLKNMALSFHWIMAASFLMLSKATMAHERWIEHQLKEPIDHSIFTIQNHIFQSLMLRSLSFALAVLGIWLLRERIATFIEKKWPQLLRISNFIFKSKGIFNLKISKLIEDAALRLPALVLIYSASGGFLLVPSFPVPEQYLNITRCIQVIMAIMIIGDICLPLVGVGLLCTMIIIFGNYGIAAFDVLPVGVLAYLYLTTRVRSQHLLLKSQQIKITRTIMGLSFLTLGSLKILFPELVIGVADNYRQVMADNLILPFWFGTSPTHVREYWALGFAFSEILTGAFITLGIFSRTISLVGAFVFTRLMLSNFGWAEFPHVFIIACLLLIALHPSKKQSSILENVLEPKLDHGKVLI